VVSLHFSKQVEVKAEVVSTMMWCRCMLVLSACGSLAALLISWRDLITLIQSLIILIRSLIILIPGLIILIPGLILRAVTALIQSLNATSFVFVTVLVITLVIFVIS
jgi:hypothetical protein